MPLRIAALAALAISACHDVGAPRPLESTKPVAKPKFEYDDGLLERIEFANGDETRILRFAPEPPKEEPEETKPARTWGSWIPKYDPTPPVLAREKRPPCGDLGPCVFECTPPNVVSFDEANRVLRCTFLGTRDGPEVSFDPAGRRLQFGFYKRGIKHGMWWTRRPKALVWTMRVVKGKSVPVQHESDRIEELWVDGVRTETNTVPHVPAARLRSLTIGGAELGPVPVAALQRRLDNCFAKQILITPDARSPVEVAARVERGGKVSALQVQGDRYIARCFTNVFRDATLATDARGDLVAHFDVGLFEVPPP